MGSDARGLGRIVNGNVDRLARRSRVSGVLSIFEDREGVCGLALRPPAWRCFESRAFSTLSEEDGLTARAVRAVYQEPEGTIWIGTDGGGLDRVAQGRAEAMVTHPVLSSDVVLSVARAGEDLWVGTPNGLNRLRAGVLRVFTTADGLPDDFVRSLYTDADGSLWIGTGMACPISSAANFGTTRAWTASAQIS